MKKRKKRIISMAAALTMVLTAAPVYGTPARAAENDRAGEEKPLKLQYFSPADKGSSERNNWERWALPLGNGHMGAMVFGRTETERIQLNEKTLWSGGTGGTDNAEGGEYDTRDPQSDAYGNVDAYGSGAMGSYIDFLFDEFYSGSTAGNGPAQSGDMKILPNNRSALGDYQNFVEMYIDFDQPTEETENYVRELDLRTALSTVSYDYNDVHYTREMFADYPDNVLVYRVTADEEGSIDLTLHPEIADLGTTSGGHSKKVTKEGTVVADEESKTITMEGTITNNNMKFAGKFRIENEGGTVTADNSDPAKGSLTVTDADSVVIYVALATNYKNEFPDYRQADADYAAKDVTERIDNASEKKYDALLESHLEDYQELFARVELDLGGTYNADEETDQLLSAWNSNSSKGTQNHYLEELYFQYGRYMLIASSRGDTLPSNLQGIWNDRAFADWQSDYHTNINLQMNYWPAYSTNLAEIGESLNSYVESLTEPGQLTAQRLFGTTGDAWMVNCSANALGFTGNINSNASLAPTANAFILQNVYDYYQYTQDKETLENELYPVMKGACDFFLQVLQSGRTEADQDKLYMVPSYSSEQGPWTVGAMFDQQLIYLLFADTLDASEELGISNEFTQQLEDTMERLYSVNIGESGQIKEWQQEGAYNRYEGTNTKIGDDAHRHNSQLMALHPGNLITTETPELLEAAKTTLELRGNGATGWSMGQKFNMWARLQDGNHAYDKLFKNLMKNGTATNLFDLHPPFQIDGNFGATAGIAELLLQSHAGYVSILPALPDELADGSVSGLVAEGNFVVDISWSGKEITHLEITSRSGNELSLKAGAVEKIIDTASGAEVTDVTQDSNGAVTFATEAGHTYQVVPGEEQSMEKAERAVEEIREKDIVSCEYTTETGEEFSEALLACERMIEQGNYMVSGVDKAVDRLVRAEEALELREGDTYKAAAGLRFLENAAEVNYTGTDTEDTWRQQIEYDRADLMESLEEEDGDAAELAASVTELVQKGNEIAGYPEYRMTLYDLIGKAKQIGQGDRTDEEWAAYNDAIETAVRIFADPGAEEEDLKAAHKDLKEAVAEMGDIFTITAAAEGSGRIDPSGEVTVLGGGSQEFRVTPDADAEILDVLVDGKSVGAVESYQFTDTDEDRTIDAVFADKAEVKSEAEALLDTAIERAQSLGDGSSYGKAGWAAVTEALAAARAADRTDETDMRTKAEALLNAADALFTWGSPVRTEAEDGAKVADGTNGDQPIGENKVLMGYPDGGPVAASGTGANGKWTEQTGGTYTTTLSGGAQMLCKTSGSWIKYAFTGARVVFISEEAMQGARIEIYIDDTLVDTIDSWTGTSSVNNRQTVVFDSEDYDLDLGEGSHVLTIVGTTGSQNYKFPIFRADAFEEYPDTASITPVAGLAELIAEVSAMPSDAYTAASWADLQDALAAAEAAVKDPAVTESAVSEAKAELEQAKAGLETGSAVIDGVTELMPVAVPVGTTADELAGMLQNSVVVTAGDRKVRVSIAWDLADFDGENDGKITLKGELTGLAEKGLSNEDGLAASVEVTVGAGETSQNTGKKTLEYFLNRAKGYVEDGTVSGLVESVRKMFEDAIAKGEAVMADEDATREEVLSAAEDLMFAIHALEMKAADKTDLEMALELAGMIDLTKYVEAGQADYLAAKEAAETVLADGDAMQDETDAAWNRLVEAMNALRLKADKSVLQDLISKTAELDLTGYTEESVSVFRAALSAANAILADDTLSADDQAEVDKAAAALRKAYDGLEKTQDADPENPDGNTGDPENPDGSQSGNNGQSAGGNGDQNGNSGQDGNGGEGADRADAGAKDSAAKTGDSQNVVLPAVGLAAAVLVIAATGILVSRRKKK